MSELAHRRFYKAATMRDVSPEDTVAAALWEIQNDPEPVSHVIVIRAHVSEEGLHYNVTQGGTFNIAERMGLIAQINQKLLDQ